MTKKFKLYQKNESDKVHKTAIKRRPKDLNVESESSDDNITFIPPKSKIAKSTTEATKPSNDDENPNTGMIKI